MAALIGAAFIVTGCNELIAIDRFFVRDAGEQERDGGAVDGGAVDAGESDAGDDACTPTTSYADLDGDGHGDPGTATESCAPAEDRVTNSDDCDDGNAGIGPGTTEICDDVDQDCDGAIDEGLIGPIGSWIEVVPDLGSGHRSTSLVAHNTGVTVLWRTDSEDLLRASFFDGEGGALESNLILAGNNSRFASVSRFSVDGLDHVLFAWVYPNEIVTRLCSTSGACSPRNAVFTGDTGGVTTLELVQLGERAIVSWEDSDHLNVVSVDPRTGAASETLVLPPVPGDGVQSGFLGLAAVDGPTQYSIVARLAAVLDGTMVVRSELALLRIHGSTVLSFDASGDVLPWETAGRCAALGGTDCIPVLFPLGQASFGVPNLSFYEQLSSQNPDGTTNNSQCLFGATATEDGWPAISECIDASTFEAFAPRNTVMMVVVDADTDYAIRDIPLGSDPSGSGLVTLPGIDPTSSSSPSIAMHRARGAVLGSTHQSGLNDLSFLRIGCMP